MADPTHSAAGTLDGEHDTICGIGPIAFPIRRFHTSIGYLV